MKKPYYIPTLERLEDRVLLSTSPLAGPPASDCVLMRTMEQHHSMEIVMSPEHCCHDGAIVDHLPQSHHCPTDLQKHLEKEEESEHPHPAHEEHFHPHAPHEEHIEHPHAPHVPHREHEEQHENHEPHVPHEERQESPLEEHETPEEGSPQPMERHENPRERDDRLLFEETLQFGSWWQEDVPSKEPIVEGDVQEKEQQESAPAAPTKELWPIIGGATVAAAALAGAYALERRARRGDSEE